jgi:hypothetical protein
MKNLMLLLLITAVVVFTGTAVAQVMNDVLGPHSVGGHGCASCHAPHSGSCGNTKGTQFANCDATTGTVALWGRAFISNTYTTVGGGQFFTPTNWTGFVAQDSDPLSKTALCLTCHDGSVTIAGMNGYTFEADNDGGHPPTWLSGQGGVTSMMAQHPVHSPYSCGGHNWDCTVNATTGTIYWGNSPQQVAFIQNYGRGAGFYAAGVGGTTIVVNGNATPSTTAASYIECTSCHNQHVMGGGNAEYKYQPQIWVTTNGNCTVGSNANNPYCGSYGSNGNAVYKVTRFFVKGWYDSQNPASNSAQQFCRQCHAGEANEENNMMTTPTT